MKSLMHLLPLVCVFFILTSCGPARVSTSSNPMYERDVLYANTWDLAELNGTVITRGDRYSYITFTPNSTKISGYTGCNDLGGTIALSGENGITFTPVISTKNICADTKLDVSLAPTLRNVDRWAVVDDRLLMYDNDKVIARWSPSKYTNKDIYGNWQLVYVSDNDIPFDVLYPVDKRPTIVFAPDKAVLSGTTGYNTISCPVSINTANGVTFTDCASTTVACEGPGESIFMGNLKSIDHYAFTDDNTLVLVTDDNRVMRFTRLR